MTYDLEWPWTVLIQGHGTMASNISKMVRYDVRLKGGQIGNRPWAFDWDHDLWPWMTLNPPSSRSLKLHVKYFENGDRYDDGFSGSRIRNHPWSIDWHHELWPWITLNRPNSRSRDFGIKYLENGERYDVGLKRGQIGNRPWAFDWDHDLWPSMTLNRLNSRSRYFGIKSRIRYEIRSRTQWGQIGNNQLSDFSLGQWSLSLDDFEPT